MSLKSNQLVVGQNYIISGPLFAINVQGKEFTLVSIDIDRDGDKLHRWEDESGNAVQHAYNSAIDGYWGENKSLDAYIEEMVESE